MKRNSTTISKILKRLPSLQAANSQLKQSQQLQSAAIEVLRHHISSNTLEHQLSAYIDKHQQGSILCHEPALANMIKHLLPEISARMGASAPQSLNVKVTPLANPVAVASQQSSSPAMLPTTLPAMLHSEHQQAAIAAIQRDIKTINSEPLKTALQNLATTLEQDKQK